MGFAQVLNDPNELKKGLLPDQVFIGSGKAAILVDVLRIDERINKWETTKYPVEKGLDITDVRYKLPEFVRLEGTLTDTQLDPRSIATTSLATDDPFSFQVWQDKKAALEELANSNEIIEITTRMHFYPKMQISLLRAMHDKDNAGCYPFVLEAEEIRTVSSTSVAVDPSQLPKEIQDEETGTSTSGQKAARGKAGKATTSGKTAAKAATQKDVDPLRSIARLAGFDV
jgi:hypothetical protein